MGTANTAASSQHRRASLSTLIPLKLMLQQAHTGNSFTETTGEKHFASICAPPWMLGNQIPSKTHSLACGRSWKRAGFASGLDPANFILKTGKKPFSVPGHRHSAATWCPAALPQPFPHTRWHGAAGTAVLPPRPFALNVPVPGLGRAPVPAPHRILHPGGQRRAARSPGPLLPAPALFPHGAMALQRGQTWMSPICRI